VGARVDLHFVRRPGEAALASLRRIMGKYSNVILTDSTNDRYCRQVGQQQSSVRPFKRDSLLNHHRLLVLSQV